MAEKILNTRILLRYDTLANWNATTTYLRKGEVAIATVATGDTQEVNSVQAPQVLIKVGDGKTLYKDLPFVTAKAGDVYSWAKQSSLQYNDLPQTLRDEIDALQAVVGTTGGDSIATQITNAINTALGGLDVEDEEVAGQVVVAVPETDGKVAPVRRALTETDIPTIPQSKVTNLETALTDLNTAINNEVTNRGTAVQGAKDYADQQVTALSTGQVKTNTDAIAAINNETTGILATAKADASKKAGDAQTAAATDATTKANQALADAKAYTDTEIGKVNTANSGLGDRIKVIEDDYLKAADKTELSTATSTVATNLANEIKRASDAETALDGRLDTVETFFATVDSTPEVVDTLKEIQEYIKSDTTGASSMAASIQQNTQDIATIKGDYLKAADKTGLETKISDEATTARAAEQANATAAANAKSAADTAQGEVDALETKVGTVPEGKTVVQMISDAQTAATYDDTAVRTLITGNTTKIDDEVTRSTNKDTEHTNAIAAINTKIGEGTFTAGTTVVGAVNANTEAISAEATRADAAEKKALSDAKAYTDLLANGQVKTNTDAITAINNNKNIVKSVTGDDVITASIANNTLTIDFDDTITFILNGGDSTGLDAGAAQA